MTPGSSINDISYGAVAPAKLASYRSLRLAVCRSSADFVNGLRRKFFSVIPRFNRFMNVFFVATPFEIVHDVVQWIVVAMSHIGHISWIRNECLCNETRKKDGSLDAVSAENAMSIAQFVGWERENFPPLKGHHSRALVRDQAVNAANAPKVGYFIKAFVSDYGQPLLTKLIMGNHKPYYQKATHNATAGGFLCPSH